MRPIYETLKRTFTKQASRPWKRVASEYDGEDFMTFSCGGDRLTVNYRQGMVFLHESWCYPNNNSVSLRFINRDEYEDFRAVFNATQKELATCGTIPAA